MKSVENKIIEKKIKVGIVGLGYVGLPLAIRFVQEGFSVIGFDIDKEKVKFLNDGKPYMNHIKKNDFASLTSTLFKPTSNFKFIKDVDVIIICVPTPLGLHNEPDLNFIEGTLESIKPYIRVNQILILGSTTYPGTTQEILIPYIDSINEIRLATNESNNKDLKQNSVKLNIGKNFFIGYSPEREDPGNLEFSTKTIPRVVSGVSSNCLKLTKLLYDQIVNKTVPVSSTKTAEMTKILENIFRSVNIGLVNELKLVVQKMDIDIHEAINAASTKPFGYMPYYPGPGLGGHCIPIDPFYLTWKAKEIGANTRFIELAGEINSAMPHFVVQKVSEGLNLSGKAVAGSKILILGLAYKRNVDDCRESPSLKIIDLLLKSGGKIFYSDPFIPKFPKIRQYNFDLKNIKLTRENIKSFDILVLVTDHDVFDYDLLLKESKMIVDTRNRFKTNKKNLIKA